VRDALMRPARLVQTSTHFKLAGAHDQWTPCSPGDPEAVAMGWESIPKGKVLAPTVTLKELLQAVQNTRPSVDPASLEQYSQWARDFGVECK